MKNIIITGSEGFIGKNIKLEIESKGLGNVTGVDIKNGIDLLDWGQVKSNLPLSDYIIHLAGKVFIPDAFNDPLSFYDTNINSTLHVLELARLHKSKVIFFSTYVYGQPQYMPIDELHPTYALNPYTASKLLSEKLCQSYYHDFGVDVTILRPFNVYGKEQSPSFLIPSILSQFSSGKVVLNDPRPKRDFVYISDVVSAVIRILELSLEGYHVFNIGYGKSISIGDIVSIISTLYKFDVPVKFLNNYRQNEVLDTIADISRAENILNWRPRISMLEGLKLILD